MVHQADLLGCDLHLLCGGRRRASMAFLGELSRYGDRVHVRPQDEHGLLDLRALLGAPDPDVRVYRCRTAPLLVALAGTTAGWQQSAPGLKVGIEVVAR
jgi:hypothetical protein